MTDFETPPIKRRADGSIDTAHYMAIGRQCRADQARGIAKSVLPRRKVYSFRFWLLGAVRTS